MGSTLFIHTQIQVRGSVSDGSSKAIPFARRILQSICQHDSGGGGSSSRQSEVRKHLHSLNEFLLPFSTSAIQPIEQPSTPTSSFTPQPSSSLSYDDFRMAAVGLGQKVHQFDQQYGVSQKCKDAAHTCAIKAKEIDNEYEVDLCRSFHSRFERRPLNWAIRSRIGMSGMECPRRWSAE